MKRVQVKWSDAAHHSPGQWISGKVDPRAYVKTVAFYKGETKHHLILAQSRLGDDFAGVFTIPKSAVLSIKHL